MADKSKTDGRKLDKSKIEADKMYRVKLNRNVPVGKSGLVFMTPVTDNRLSGDDLLSGLVPDDAIELIEQI